MLNVPKFLTNVMLAFDTEEQQLEFERKIKNPNPHTKPAVILVNFPEGVTLHGNIAYVLTHEMHEPSKKAKPEFSTIGKEYIEPMLFETFYPQDGEWRDTLHPSNDPFSETAIRYLVSLIVRKGDLTRYLKCLAQIKGKAPFDSATYFEEMKAIFMTYNLISESLDESDSFHIHLN